MEIIKLNIIPNGTTPTCHVSQYDNGRVIRIELYEGLNPYTLSASDEISLAVRKPDNTIVTKDVTNTQADYLDIETTEQMCAVQGYNTCELKIKNGLTVIAMLNFIMQVQPDPTAHGVPSGSALDNLQEQVNECVEVALEDLYDGTSVIFDSEPVANHNAPYTVTSAGIKTALDNAFNFENTASGSLVHIEDGADNIPVKSLVSQIVAVESGNGQPKSPTNPYSISGFDNGIVPVCGANLIKKQALMQPVHLASGTTIYTKLFNFSGQFNLYGLKKGLPDIPANWTALIMMRNTLRSVTLTDDYDYIGISSGAYSDLGSGDMRVSLVPFSDFSAYNGNTYTFAFGQTVYGGHFDNKGNLVVTHKIVDFADLGYYYSNNRFSSTDIPDVKNVSVWNSALTMCSCYDITEVQTWTQGDFIIGLYGKNIYVKDSRYTDTASFKQALTGQKFVVELANPITLAITSQDIPTLLGENNIFSNCGDVEVDYFTEKANAIADIIKAFI